MAALWTTVSAGARYMLLSSAGIARKPRVLCHVGARITPASAGKVSEKAMAGTQAYQRRSRRPSLSTSQPAANVPMKPVTPSTKL